MVDDEEYVLPSTHGPAKPLKEFPKKGRRVDLDSIAICLKNNQSAHHSSNICFSMEKGDKMGGDSEGDPC